MVLFDSRELCFHYTLAEHQHDRLLIRFSVRDCARPAITGVIWEASGNYPFATSFDSGHRFCAVSIVSSGECSYSTARLNYVTKCAHRTLALALMAFLFDGTAPTPD